MNFIKKAVLPQGFLANGVASGIKLSGKLDLALFFSQAPCLASGKFTTNSVAAAPVVLDKKLLKSCREFHALLVNSGNANAFNGIVGWHDALAMERMAANALGLRSSPVLLASTGIIGRRLAVDKIKKALPKLTGNLSAQGIARAKQAIKTTDKFTKEVSVKFKVGAQTVTICGIAKGAGMISPRLATMLVFIFTDANITPGALDRALNTAVENSFNCITVDGCMSTNDTVLVLANKLAGNPRLEAGKDLAIFENALQEVCLRLAKMIVKDGEGATKFITIKVLGAKSDKVARTIALSVANSNLFKTAMFASSANIVGRIVASVGATGAAVNEEDICLKYSPLHKTEVDIRISVGDGRGKAIVYTSDLSFEYVKINAEYS